MTKKLAVITGGGKGIGKAIAKRLAADGFFTVIVDMDPASGESVAAELGAPNAVFYQADISNESQVKDLFNKIETNHGRLDVLINNAGIISDNMIWNMDAADFDKVISVNLRGTWLMCREAAKKMRSQDSGRIINISSRAWMGNRGQTNYSASKAGVIGLSRSLALELGKHNVLVNVVAPGLIDTPLTRELKKEVLEKLIEAQPSKKMGDPDDVANAVSFLAAESTHFITGQIIYVDGGKCIGGAL